ncbi:MAG TPA: enoyl-CoA hydratase [Deltaproteobacteria bacterium]|nr:enoyl-CoA hydratase [Deltaproteobacteria bacterium]
MEEEKKRVFVEKKSLKVADQYMGLLTLNRPKELNPLDWSTVKEVYRVLEDLAGDKSVRVIAITGAGKAFSAGGDMKGYLTLMKDEVNFKSFLNDMCSMCKFMGTLAQPIIALVNGYCVAGGIELLLACDFAYAATSAKIGDGHANFGQVGGGGSNVRLPRWIFPQRARELLFTGRLLNAQEALEWGIVNRVVPDDKLLEAGLEFANEVASKSPLGVKVIKEICNRGINMELDDALHLEILECHHYCLTSFDCHEGLLAFSEKRQPKFEGR